MGLILDGANPVLPSAGAVTAAAIRTALAAPSQVGTDLTFTTNNGSASGGSASVAAGVVTLTHAASVTSAYIHGDYSGPRAYAAFAPADPTRWRVVGRLTASGGANTGSRCGIGLMQTAGTNEPSRLLVCAPGLGGNVTINSASAVNYQSIPGATMPSNGTGWYRITRLGGAVLYEYGTGTTSAEPTAWTVVWTEVLNGFAASTDNTATDPGPGLTLLLAFGQPASAPGTPPVCTWSHLRVYDL